MAFSIALALMTLPPQYQSKSASDNHLIKIITCHNFGLGVPRQCGTVLTFKKAIWLLRFTFPSPGSDETRSEIGQQSGMGANAEGRIGNSVLHQPFIEFRRPLQAEDLADIERVVEGGRLVVQHHVIGPGNPHDEGDAGRCEQRQEIVYVVLIGLGVIGVTDIDTERQAEQLAAEMILQPRADDLLAVKKIFRPDETDDAVDQKRIEGARHRVSARLAGLLIDSMMRIGRQRGPLSGLEIHDVVADRAAPERPASLMRLAQKCEIHAETAIGGLRSRDRL